MKSPLRGASGKVDPSTTGRSRQPMLSDGRAGDRARNLCGRLRVLTWGTTCCNRCEKTCSRMPNFGFQGPASEDLTQPNCCVRVPRVSAAALLLRFCKKRKILYDLLTTPTSCRCDIWPALPPSVLPAEAVASAPGLAAATRVCCGSSPSLDPAASVFFRRWAITAGARGARVCHTQQQNTSKKSPPVASLRPPQRPD